MSKNFFDKDKCPYEKRTTFANQYLFTHLMLIPYYKLFFRMEVHGRENIPSKDGLIYASSHGSYHDPPLLAAATELHIAYMAKKELFDVPVLAEAITGLGAFPVNRKKLEISTIKIAKRILKSRGWNLGIFPQGTRVMDGTMGDVKPGFSYLAKTTGVPVLPVYINVKHGLFPFYGKVVVQIGEPLPPSDDVDEIQKNWENAIIEMKKSFK
jgi:1-acyl-sn-glycerol-3-phosphate acyltransferase